MTRRMTISQLFTTVPYVLFFQRFTRTLHDATPLNAQRDRSVLEQILDTEKASLAIAALLTVIALALRFYKINHPDQVV